jgi:hypothetical protein
MQALSKAAKVAAAGSILMFSVLAGPAAALPPESVYKQYFTDATHSEKVGEYALYCNGQTYSGGIVTEYVEVEREPC